MIAGMQPNADMINEQMFAAYSVPHWLALCLTIVLSVAVARRARRQTNPRRDPVLLWGLRAFALATIVPHHAVKVFVDGKALLGLCDLAGITALVVLFKPSRFGAALLLYWGLTLTPNALVTPDLPAPAFSLPYFLFFGSHIAVVVTACFATFGERLVLSWRLYATVVVFTLAILGGVLVYNLVFDANYMYLRHKPPSGSILDLLGQWPWYIVAGILLTTSVWAALTVPFLSRRTP